MALFAKIQKLRSDENPKQNKNAPRPRSILRIDPKLVPLSSLSAVLERKHKANYVSPDLPQRPSSSAVSCFSKRVKSRRIDDDKSEPRQKRETRKEGNCAPNPRIIPCCFALSHMDFASSTKKTSLLALLPATTWRNQPKIDTKPESKREPSQVNGLLRDRLPFRGLALYLRSRGLAASKM